jgi:hypothetical protein
MGATPSIDLPVSQASSLTILISTFDDGAGGSEPLSGQQDKAERGGNAPEPTPPDRAPR